jgi:hypothetical protein
VFLETVDDSALALKGLPGDQMGRRIENMIWAYRNDASAESAAAVMDSHLRTPEGQTKGDAIMAWLDDSR